MFLGLILSGSVVAFNCTGSNVPYSDLETVSNAVYSAFKAINNNTARSIRPCNSLACIASEVKSAKAIGGIGCEVSQNGRFIGTRIFIYSSNGNKTTKDIISGNITEVADDIRTHFDNVVAAEKSAIKKSSAERASLDKIAAAEKEATDRIQAMEKAFSEKLAAMEKASAERIVIMERASAERIAASKAEAQRFAENAIAEKNAYESYLKAIEDKNSYRGWCGTFESTFRDSWYRQYGYSYETMNTPYRIKINTLYSGVINSITLYSDNSFKPFSIVGCTL